MPNRKRAPSSAPNQSARAGATSSRSSQTRPPRGGPDHTVTTAPAEQRDLDQLCIDTIRTLAIDAVQKANSGHPGTPMGWRRWPTRSGATSCATIPKTPHWPNRDRFVLSVGPRLDAALRRCCILARRARRSTQGASRSAGPRSPSTTSSSSASSTAYARAIRNITHHRRRDHHRAARPGRARPASAWRWPSAGWRSATTAPASTIFDYDVYALCSDGDMMEGVSSEAASLAGHLQLANLCWIYDDNHVTIEGSHRPGLQRRRGRAVPRPTAGTSTTVDDANDGEAIAAALEHFKATTDAPTLIVVRQPHRLRRAAQAGHQRRPRRAARRGGGQARQAGLRLAGGRTFPGSRRRAASISPTGIGRARRASCARTGSDAAGGLPRKPSRISPRADADPGRRAAGRLGRRPAKLPGRREGHRHPRGLGQGAERASREKMPWLIGGAADLSPSTKTDLDFDGAGDFEPGDYGGRNLHFGVREHAMGAAPQRPGADRSCAPTARHLPDLQRLHEAARSGWRR